MEHFRGKAHANKVRYLDDAKHVQVFQRLDGVVVRFDHLSGEVESPDASGQISGDEGKSFSRCAQAHQLKALASDSTSKTFKEVVMEVVQKKYTVRHGISVYSRGGESLVEAAKHMIKFDSHVLV